jgi:hypothetical protein
MIAHAIRTGGGKAAVEPPPDYSRMSSGES